MKMNLCKHFVVVLTVLLCTVNWSLAQNNVKGTWSPVYNSDMVPVAAANLPNGKILAWSAKAKLNFGGNEGKTYTSIFDPVNNTFSTTLVSNIGHDMFCPGTANTGKGEVIVTGGSSSSKTSIYDPISNSWRIGDEMNVPRGYHAMTTLSDGRVFTLGGSWGGGQMNKVAEVWNESTGWQRLDDVDSDKTVRQGAPDPGGIFRDDNHAWLFAAPGGNVYQVGPGTDMHYISTSGSGNVMDVGKRGNNPYSMNGNATMYDAGKVLAYGGAATYGNGTVATNQTHIINLNTSSPTVTQSGNLNIARTLQNGVVLPNGEVVAIGGLPESSLFSDENAILAAEIWNPVTGNWKTGANMTVPRTYHSTAILMQDGRVWAAGGGLCGGCTVNHPDAEIYSPPYLYNANNQLATRPLIQSAPTTANYNSSVSVVTNSAIQSFALVRLSSVTHSVNNEQRRIAVSFSSTGGNNYSVNIPSNDWLPPGYYFLFAMNNSGVPSIGKVMKISNDGTTTINGLNATYYNNLNFSGSTYTRVDPQINFDWGVGSPHSSIDADTYSARWEGFVEAPTSGTYTFYTRTDDGVRLWVNNQQIIDKWVNQGPTEISGTIQLTAGQKVSIRMDYYENGGGAVAQLSWQGPSVGKQIIPSNRFFTEGNVTPNGLNATYYNNLNFSGSTYNRVDSQINFDWGVSSPHNSIDVDTYSARWEGFVEAPTSGTYTFYTRTDDGVRLWVNNQQIIDKWVNQGPTEISGTIQLTTGQKVPIRMDYYEDGGGAVAQLSWQGPSVGKQIIPSNYLFTQDGGSPTINCNNPQNVAVGKSASQSSNYNSSVFPASKAIDGNTAGNAFNHTQNDQNAWWEVDLGQVYDLTTIQVFNRTDCCQSRLNDFHVLVSEAPFNSKQLSATINQIGVSDYNFPSAPSAQTDFSINRRGRYVRVQLSGRNYLHLAEVKVLGCSIGGSSDCTLRQLPGAALDVGAGGGSTYVVGTNRRIYKWNGANWNILPAGPAANRIDVESNGTPWVVATDGKIYRLVNNNWLNVSGWASDVGCGGDKVYVIGGGNRIYGWNGGNSWSAISTGTGKRIDVWQDGNPWIVGTDNRIYQRHNNQWLLKGTFTARDIGLQEGGQRIWALAESNGTVHNYLGGGNWENHSGTANHISVNRNGDVWIVDDAQKIFVNDCPTIPRSSVESTENTMYVYASSERKVRVQWIIDQQYSPESYVLEYAKEDGSFEVLETFSAEETTDWEVYQTVHSYPLAGDNHYQVRIIYPDGVEDVLPFQTVRFEEFNSPIGIFPNPTQDVVNIDLQNYMDLSVEYMISTLEGKFIAEGRYENFHPMRVQLDLSLFKNGMYIISLKPENHRRVSLRLVVEKDY